MELRIEHWGMPTTHIEAHGAREEAQVLIHTASISKTLKYNKQTWRMQTIISSTKVEWFGSYL